jgi:hypothetical protein
VPVIGQLAAHRQTRFVDHAAWQAHLDRLGISALRVTPDPVQIATEARSAAAFRHMVHDAVVRSNDAGQSAIGRHAVCWVVDRMLDIAA